ncbi:MarR family winged helix-turn-helix transcriptional regulator [Daejeonella sp.]|uniref:MarR family winged helix-turn-helix transcriptional regulator n=1 Tax=Daejeonella sp. TaxID=2805397 RepID=UPI00271BF63C|nr:winged helix DNA-binding protein [Daejeonella sp.]MDO8993162.1 MarR family transcriptional regulator [Daejeonella sp.]MDP2415064.1 MarR family transcriptional regulator [Daejeonella sp.]
MKSYKLGHQLLSLLEQFETESNGRELLLNDFTGFLVNHLEHSEVSLSSSDVRFGKREAETQELAYQIDNAIGRLFVYMSRYAKSYIKKTLEGTPLQSPEDFTALAILLTHESLTKGELISRNIQEKTSGTEVIRRLLAAGLVKQWDDQTDKRSRRISITESGKQLLHRVFDDMNYVGKMVTGNLSYSEKLNLQYLLQKLETFHFQLHEDKVINTKEDIRSIALNSK